MADFFANLEDLGKIISKKAGKAVDVVTQKAGEAVDVISKKAEETVEITKIKSQIGTMERNNERDYKDIGKMIYERYKNGEVVDGEFIELCEAISEREDSIEVMEKVINIDKDVTADQAEIERINAEWQTKLDAALEEAKKDKEETIKRLNQAIVDLTK